IHIKLTSQLQLTCAESSTAVLHLHPIWKPSYQEILYLSGLTGTGKDTNPQESLKVSFIE
ncbi:hypothetical protein, partial [[Clostridium] aminophilum]